MHERFRAVADSLEPKYQELIRMAPVTYANLPRALPVRAIYLFSEGGKDLYVGRTNNLRSRLRGHCAPGSKHFSAVFAFRIARLSTGRIKPSYKAEGSRGDLSEDPVFKPAFLEAKRRVAAMEIRFVEEEDPIHQALLEIYVATVLQTPFNEFDNH